jgi:hypothetical protein
MYGKRRQKMQRQADRLTNVMDGKLGKIKLSDKCKGEATGPQLVPAQDPNGAPTLTIGWQFTVWLEHDKLLGQDPVGASIPVPGLLPSAELVERVTAKLLDDARQIRFSANQEAAGFTFPSMDRLKGIGQNGSG